MQDTKNTARFRLGQIVRHRDDAFEGLIMDVDAGYAGPREETGHVCADQPFYHVLVVAEAGRVMAYAAEDVLVATPDVESLSSGQTLSLFTVDQDGHHAPRDLALQ
jgi:heat shock protein HspQ